MQNKNPDVLAIVKLGYRYATVAWLKSLTPKGMKYGNATAEERIEAVKKNAQLAGIADIQQLAKKAHLA